MSETNIPQFQEIPSIDATMPDQMNSHTTGLYRADEAPVFMTSLEGRASEDDRTRILGGTVLDVLRNRHRIYNYHFVQEHQTGTPAIATPEHFDGITVDPFVQIHTNTGPAIAEVTFLDRSISPEVAEKLRTAYQSGELGDKEWLADRYEVPLLMKKLPPEVVYSPIVAAYRGYLHPGESLAFRNGFNVNKPTEVDKSMVSHIFTSVDENGEPIDSARKISVGYVRPNAVRQRRGLFGRRRAA